MGEMDESRIDAFMEQEIRDGHLPGAVLAVAVQGQPVMKRAYGCRAVYPQKEAMEWDTVFDMASLTKVLATLPAILKLAGEGRLSLDDTIGGHIRGYADNAENPITIRHLLTHTSGLRAGLPMKEVMAMSREELLERVRSERPLSTPGKEVVYSDLGFILLQLIAEQAAGEPFTSFLEREIYAPLGMKDTGFLPSFEPSRYASTEYSEVAGAYKRGVVHDEKAERMGGISGHAGLFSTAEDVLKFASMIHAGGRHEGREILAESWLAEARRNQTPFAGEFRGLGWQLANPDSPNSAGSLLSAASYGHTGFTGTSIWFDPERELQIVLLTNRVHFGRTDAILRIRPQLHDLISSCF